MTYIITLLFVLLILLIVYRYNKTAICIASLAGIWFTAIILDLNDGVDKSEYYWDSYYTPLLAPVNCFVRFTSPPDERGPILSNDLFPLHAEIESHWKIIAKEAEGLIYEEPIIYEQYEEGSIDIPLFWYGEKEIENIEKCPKTMELLKKDPNIQGAVFSLLPPGYKVPPHIDALKSCICYQLALVVPSHKEDCFMEINGEKYFWKEGQGVLIDPTFVHSMENNTKDPRIILFIVVKRPNS